MKEKLFKDPVHGYIPIEDHLCKNFIDQRLFQRLRQIEQTSMRPLYPGARHDRFIHSLGVYYLGRRAVNSLFKNTPISVLPNANRERLKKTFEIACLMHDCGHAPFSHTTEHFYNHSDSKKNVIQKMEDKRANKFLLSLCEDEFKNDFNQLDASPAEHEVFSAALLMRDYKDKISKFGDPELAVRMITGVKHVDISKKINRIENAFIELLNGTAIDVDKLDYILRDTWASGIKNTTVDVERLLDSLVLCKEENCFRICFKKSALSVIQSVVDARNYLYEWVYSHHTVIYYTHLMNQLLRELSRIFSTIEKPDIFWDTVFSQRAFEKKVQIGRSGLYVFLPTDGDLIYLLKTKLKPKSANILSEVLSHTPEKVAIWKTYAEFKRIIKKKQIDQGEKSITQFRSNASKRLQAYVTNELGIKCKKTDFLVKKVEPKIATIEEGSIRISFNGEMISYTDLFDEKPMVARRYFYVFVPVELKKHEADLINAIFG